MAYDLRIVRTKDWTESADAPIAKMEVDGLIAADSYLAWSTTDYVDMVDESGESMRLINRHQRPQMASKSLGGNSGDSTLCGTNRCIQAADRGSPPNRYLTCCRRLNGGVRPLEPHLNPYESPIAANDAAPKNSADNTLVADDSMSRALALFIGASSVVCILIAIVQGLYGLILVAATIDGRGRFEGRAIITIPIAVVLFTTCLFFATIGVLAIRSSLRRYKNESAER